MCVHEKNDKIKCEINLWMCKAYNSMCMYSMYWIRALLYIWRKINFLPLVYISNRLYEVIKRWFSTFLPFCVQSIHTHADRYRNIMFNYIYLCIQCVQISVRKCATRFLYKLSLPILSLWPWLNFVGNIYVFVWCRRYFDFTLNECRSGTT